MKAKALAEMACSYFDEAGDDEFVSNFSKDIDTFFREAEDAAYERAVTAAEKAPDQRDLIIAAIRALKAQD